MVQWRHFYKPQQFFIATRALKPPLRPCLARLQLPWHEYISIQRTKRWITNKKLYWGSVTYFASEMKYATYNSVSRIQHYPESISQYPPHRKFKISNKIKRVYDFPLALIIAEMSIGGVPGDIRQIVTTRLLMAGRLPPSGAPFRWWLKYINMLPYTMLS